MDMLVLATSLRWNSTLHMQDTAFGCCVPSCNWIGNAAFQATKQQHVYAAAPISKAGQGRAGQGRAGQGRAGQGRAGQGRAGRKACIHGRSPGVRIFKACLNLASLHLLKFVRACTHYVTVCYRSPAYEV